MAVTDKKLWAKFSEHFRTRRNQALSALIADIPEARILDVGGLPGFWATVPNAAAAQEIAIVNYGTMEFASLEEMQATKQTMNATNMHITFGDARALEYGTKEFDLVVCNSMLEHVGAWRNVELAAAELLRVGKHGWVQVPAYEFPLEVHYMRPFVHWLAEPARASALRATSKRFRNYSPAQFRDEFENTRLLTKEEMKSLFPDARYTTERFAGFRKSHIITW
jgi:ubiquinone/menaquinone biosynthesis C-methylase UbiE